MIPPSDLDFFAQLDRVAIQAKNEKLSSPIEGNSTRPKEMDEDVFETLRALLEPNSQSEPILRIPYIVPNKGMFAVDQAGKRLALIQGSQLELWDLSSLVKKTSLLLPSDRCHQVLWDTESDHLVLVDNHSLYRLNLNSGSILQTWKPPDADEPRFVSRAAKTSKYAVSTKSNRLYALGREFQAEQLFIGAPLDNDNVAIQADGKSIFCLSSGAMVRWQLEPSGVSKDVLFMVAGQEPIVSLLAVQKSGYVAFPQRCLVTLSEGIPSFARSIQSSRTPGQIEIYPRVHGSILGTDENNIEWVTNCLSRADSDGTKTFFIQDFDMEKMESSSEFPVGKDPILEFCSDDLTETIALRSDKEIRIYRRQPWQETTGKWTIGKVATLALDGRFQQLELAADLLKKQRTKHYHGEVLFSRIARSVAEKWAQQENLKKSRMEQEIAESRLRRLEQWRATDSELAILSSCNRQLELVERIDRPFASIEDVKARFEKPMEFAESELQSLSSDSRQSFAALDTSLRIGANRRRSMKQQSETVKQLLESYPFLDSFQRVLNDPRMRGTTNESGAFVANVAGLFPQPKSDFIYARTACDWMHLNRVQPFDPQLGISLARIQSAVEKCSDLAEFDQKAIECFLAMITANPQQLDRLADYHVRHFPFFSNPSLLESTSSIAPRLRSAVDRMNGTTAQQPNAPR